MNKKQIDEKRLKELLDETITEIKNVGIPISSSIESITVNTRAKARFGCCKLIKKSPCRWVYRIEISQSILGCEEKHIKEIIAHELLHTCKDCMNHGEVWKNYAKKLNDVCGYNIKTTTSYESLGLESSEKSIEEFKYAVVCQGCGNIIYRKRQCNLTRFPENYKCGICGGILRLYETPT